MTNPQRIIPILSAVAPAKPAPDSLVRRVETDAQAIAISIEASGVKQSYIAAAMGRSPAWLSRMRHGSLAMTDEQAARFCDLTGSLLLLQVRALREAMAEAMGQVSAAQQIRRYAAELRRAA